MLLSIIRLNNIADLIASRTLNTNEYQRYFYNFIFMLFQWIGKVPVQFSLESVEEILLVKKWLLSLIRKLEENGSLWFYLIWCIHVYNIIVYSFVLSDVFRLHIHT